jgi:ABC-type transporter Mla subunit MlaD
VTEFEDRFTKNRLSRARLALEARRSVRPSLVILAMFAVGILCFAYVIQHVAKTLLTSSQTVSFAVDDATAVVSGGVDEVRYKGIPAGKIKDVKMVDGKQPVITVEFESEYGKIFKDARAELRPNTALLDMYLNITDRGTPAAGEAGTSTPIPASHTQTGVKVSDVLQTFRADTRARLRTMLDQLGNGLDDRGERLQQAFVDLVPLLQSAGRVSQQLAARAPETQRLIHNVGVLTTELGSRESSLRRLVYAGSTALGTLQRNAQYTDATLHELPRTVAALQSSFTATRGVLGDVNTALKSLYPVADRLPQSLEDVRRLSDTGTPAVRALQQPVTRLVPLADALTPLATNLQGAIAALRPQAPVVNYVVNAVDRCHVGLNGFFQWDASMAKYGDARGPSPRGNVAFGAQTTSALNDPNEFAPQACEPGKAIPGRLPRPSDAR